jgi:alcohol dehydrogenase (NADP+)
MKKSRLAVTGLLAASFRSRRRQLGNHISALSLIEPNLFPQEQSVNVGMDCTSDHQNISHQYLKRESAHKSHKMSMQSLFSLFLLAPLTLATPSPLPSQSPIKPPTTPIPGIDIPSIGLGLWNSLNSTAVSTVSIALRSGYRHLDSASAYNNEPSVGAGLEEALNSSKFSRSDIWITSKLWNTDHRPSLVQTALSRTLHDLNTTHLDLYLMHWPVAFRPDTSHNVLDLDVTIQQTWEEMESLVTANLTRYIGVSNFSPRQLDAILAKCEICPFAHEFELHPYLQQRQFVEWHAANQIKVIAYSPLGNLNPTYNGTHSNLPSILEDKFWISLAKEKNITVPQAVLGWNRARGVSVIPKASSKEHIVENLGSVVEFSDEEMALISGQDRGARFNDPSKAWGVDPPLFEGLDGGSDRFVSSEDVDEL